MGQLLYGAVPSTFEIDDRALAHIELVVVAKLRRNENFAFSVDAVGGSERRDTVWLNAASTLQFSYASKRPEINRAWLDILIDAANSPGGLRVIPEP